MKNNIYGVLIDGTHFDTSKTLLGAKIYATKHGYNEISIRYNYGYTVRVVAKKVNNKWLNIN